MLMVTFAALSCALSAKRKLLSLTATKMLLYLQASVQCSVTLQKLSWNYLCYFALAFYFQMLLDLHCFTAGCSSTCTVWQQYTQTCCSFLQVPCMDRLKDLHHHARRSTNIFVLCSSKRCEGAEILPQHIWNHPKLKFVIRWKQSCGHVGAQWKIDQGIPMTNLRIASSEEFGTDTNCSSGIKVYSSAFGECEPLSDLVARSLQ